MLNLSSRLNSYEPTNKGGWRVRFDILDDTIPADIAEKLGIKPKEGA